jgi:AraC family transcriptional regulator
MSKTEPSATLTSAEQYRQGIDAVMRYMQEHAEDALTLPLLAGVAGFSPYHFHRIFSAMVGETLGEYLRRIRLEQARSALLETHAPITTIALDAGYATPAAFTKAFKRSYAVAPSAMRRNGGEAHTQSALRQLPTFHHFEGSHSMQATVQQLPERRIIYVERKGSVEENFNAAAKDGFATLMGYIGKHGLFGDLGPCLAITPDDPEQIEPAERRIQVAFIVNSQRALPVEAGVEESVIPAARTAVIEYRGPYEQLWKAWEEVYRDWLPTSGEQPSDFPPYEVYVSDPAVTPQAELITHICVPVQ